VYEDKCCLWIRLSVVGDEGKKKRVSGRKPREDLGVE